MELKGEHIFVTGASKGIGAGIAKSLLEAGATLSLHYNSGVGDLENSISAYPGAAHQLVQANFEDTAAIRKLFSQVIEFHSPLNTLILNAGIFIPHEPGMDPETWWEVWQKTLRINLDACGLLTKLALDHFMENGGGRIIYIGSRAAFRGETADYLAYAASKGGVTSLARSVARSFGKFGVKSFVVAPGFTRTPMAEPFIEQAGEEKILEELALNELTEPKDIAPLIRFICSGQMDHATGTTIDVNAGSYMH